MAGWQFDCSKILLNQLAPYIKVTQDAVTLNFKSFIRYFWLCKTAIENVCIWKSILLPLHDSDTHDESRYSATASKPSTCRNKHQILQ